jgi:IS5 family transposase
MKKLYSLISSFSHGKHHCYNSQSDVYSLNECDRHVKMTEHSIQMGHSNPISGPYYLTIGVHVAEHCATRRKVAGAIPHDVTGIFH